MSFGGAHTGRIAFAIISDEYMCPEAHALLCVVSTRVFYFSVEEMLYCAAAGEVLGQLFREPVESEKCERVSPQFGPRRRGN